MFVVALARKILVHENMNLGERLAQDIGTSRFVLVLPHRSFSLDASDLDAVRADENFVDALGIRHVLVPPARAAAMARSHSAS